MQNSQKHAFTLAEILIVLTLIGAMAVMTIPSLMQGTNSQQKVTQFKKAFNTVTNAYATEFAIKDKPTTAADIDKVFNALKNQLNVKYFIDAGDNGTGTTKTYTAPTANYKRYWIVTEDGVGYKIVPHSTSTTTCAKKLALNGVAKDTTVQEVTTGNDAAIAASNNQATVVTRAAACMYITVDVGGIKSSNQECKDSTSVDSLGSCDRIDFYVASDGISTGTPDKTITAKIISKDKD